MAKTKGETPTTTTPQEQAVEAKNLEQAAQRLEEAQQTVKLLKAVLKDQKKAKVKVPCAKAGCKLFAMEGRADGMCSNHRPEWDKLTEEEQKFAEDWSNQMTSGELVELLGAHGIRAKFADVNDPAGRPE